MDLATEQSEDEVVELLESFRTTVDRYSSCAARVSVLREFSQFWRCAQACKLAATGFVLWQRPQTMRGFQRTSAAFRRFGRTYRQLHRSSGRSSDKC
eukprot:SAG31_NODE_4898_length_2878_cov_2.329975_2_plen_97_part_00